MKHAEEVIVRLELGVRRIGLVVAERDAVSVDPAILAGPGAARQAALVDQPGDEFHGAVFGKQRGVEADLVQPVHDVV